MVTSFDIESLLHFSPPKRMCEKCYGLHHDMPISKDESKVICRVCGLEYLASDRYPVWVAQRYFEAAGFGLKYKDVLAHSQTLATIARRMRNYAVNRTKGLPITYTPMTCLFDALQAAQQFVHFTTYGMSLQLIGALRMTALRIPVRGIISNASPALSDEFVKHSEESPKLDVKLFERSTKKEDWDAAPHQKVIVIDGLMAFKGSANLTVEGWRKAAQGLDYIEVETDVKQVMDLHNQLFSSVWGSFSNVSQITMQDDIPF
jgi:hypothetical protein